MIDYADSEEHLKYTKWLCRNLKKHGQGAIVLRDDEIDKTSDVTGGLIDVFSKVRSMKVKSFGRSLGMHHRKVVHTLIRVSSRTIILLKKPFSKQPFSKTPFSMFLH